MSAIGCMMLTDGDAAYARFVYELHVQGFLHEYQAAYRVKTYDDKRRQLNRIGDDIEKVYISGKIDTMNPTKFTYNDIKEVAAGMRRIHPDLQINTLNTLHLTLKKLLLFYGNHEFEVAVVRFPMLFPKKIDPEPEPFDAQEFDRVVDHILRPDQNRVELRTSAAVALSLFAGLRAQEVRFLEASALDLENNVIRLQHVKGTQAYGRLRSPPIHEIGAGVLAAFIQEHGRSGYLFRNESGRPLADNTIRKDMHDLSEACGVRVTASRCRDTYIQRLIDLGVRRDKISTAAGHKYDTTTMRFYGRPGSAAAAAEIREAWKPRCIRDSELEDCDRKANGRGFCVKEPASEAPKAVRHLFFEQSSGPRLEEAAA